MIIVDLDQFYKLKTAMGYDEYTYGNTHQFFLANGIKINLIFNHHWELRFEDHKKETLYRIQYSDIL